MSLFDEATALQIEAAQPHASTWLSANAGSGKTRVLTDRVARLLLEQVEPQHILCLTYTRAAASEMQNRLFERLGEWAMRTDDVLRTALQELGVEQDITRELLAGARRLFARAIEAPGGLKIQTIHSFCASLLRRFPLEAQVSPQFREMDDRAAALLRIEIVEAMAQGSGSDAIAQIARYLTDEDIEKLTSEIVKHKSAFSVPLEPGASLASHGLPERFDEVTLLKEVFLGSELALLEDVRRVVENGSAMDVKAAARLAQIDTINIAALRTLEGILLTGKGTNAGSYVAKIDRFPTKDSQAKLGAQQQDLNALMERVEAAREKRLGLFAAAKTTALHNFAQPFLAEYARRKQTLGWLDFDDLILKARDLLHDPAVAAWVLYRLDGGIDHILVDEAQDTSPVQWEVIERLAQEFTSGAGARGDTPRTIFVVGDKKQSIYSFQGADPREFDRMRDEFSDRLSQTNTPLKSKELKHSFRSAEAILRLVDCTFEGKSEAGFVPEQEHKAFKSEMPGRVDLWPAIEKSDAPDTSVWSDPVDQLSNNHHSTILANQIAREIRQLLDDKATIPEEIKHSGKYRARRLHEGDFLILVQRRSDLFQEIIRACKGENLAVAGADRLKVGAELAVKDLAAMLAFLATPEDSLSLATALRSPLFGWDEQALFDLAHRRTQTHLWAALRDRADEFPQVMEILNDLRNVVDYLRPYDLIERILTRHNGRKALLGRLGAEAEDGINALLSQALAYERNTVPSLTGFLVWMEADELEIKRQAESAGRQIRVMTVHGAKGLESPVVIMPDTANRRLDIKDSILESSHVAQWKPLSADMPKSTTAMIDAMKEAQMAERERLLYVAMTRAEKWLIIAAAGDVGEDQDSWYSKAQVGMKSAGAIAYDFENGFGLRYETGSWAALEEAEEHRQTSKPVHLPSFFQSSAATPCSTPKTLSPSMLEGAKALPSDLGLDESAALKRGSQIHKLLEVLPLSPVADWPELAPKLLRSNAETEGESSNESLIKEATRVLSNPAFASLFASGSLAEVAISAKIPSLDNQRIHGVIDCLIISDTDVRAIDFKTNASVPADADACPLGILRQMGAYSEALSQIYPNHIISCEILWTRTATLMVLPHDLVTKALNTTSIS